MPILHCYVTDEALDRLKRYAEWSGGERTPEQIAEAAIEEAALECDRCLPKAKGREDRNEHRTCAGAGLAKHWREINQ